VEKWGNAGDRQQLYFIGINLWRSGEVAKPKVWPIARSATSTKEPLVGCVKAGGRGVNEVPIEVSTTSPPV